MVSMAIVLDCVLVQFRSLPYGICDYLWRRMPRKIHSTGFGRVLESLGFIRRPTPIIKEKIVNAKGIERTVILLCRLGVDWFGQD